VDPHAQPRFGEAQRGRTARDAGTDNRDVGAPIDAWLDAHGEIVFEPVRDAHEGRL